MAPTVNFGEIVRTTWRRTGRGRRPKRRSAAAWRRRTIVGSLRVGAGGTELLEYGGEQLGGGRRLGRAPGAVLEHHEITPLGVDQLDAHLPADEEGCHVVPWPEGAGEIHVAIHPTRGDETEVEGGGAEDAALAPTPVPGGDAVEHEDG